MSPTIIVLDNGAGTCKLGIGGESHPRKVFPNCTAKPKGDRVVHVGEQLLDAKDISELNIRRPFDRGFLVNWELQRDIWTRSFKSSLQIAPKDACLVMTEPLFNFPQLQQITEQVVFEEYQFQAFFSAPAPFFSIRRAASLYRDNPVAATRSGIVIDSGFSFTHVVPFFDGQILWPGVKRINMGGKAMTNYLKELLSYRQLNMMDETYLVEYMKEKLAFVSLDVKKDLAKCQPPSKSVHKREFVLPDRVNSFRGYVKGEGNPESGGEGAPAAIQEQCLVLNNERFMVMDLLFSPGDIGLQQAGIPETIVQAVSALHPALHPLLYQNVVLTGGNASCPNFKERVEQELRAIVPDDYTLNVHLPPDPTLCAWEGMSEFVASGEFNRHATSAQQYEGRGR